MDSAIEIKILIDRNDVGALQKALAANPSLANAGVDLSPGDTRKAHPLHRICDAVSVKKISEDDAIAIAKIFLAAGADIDGDKLKTGAEPPIIAAASLHAEQVGIFYIDKGANVGYTGIHAATALHWAAHGGMDKLTAKLIGAGANINLQDSSFSGTPVDWAIHELKERGGVSKSNQVACVKLLLQAGADTTLMDKNTLDYLDVLAPDDAELKALLEK